MHTKKYFHIHQSFFFLLLIIYTVESSKKPKRRCYRDKRHIYVNNILENTYSPEMLEKRGIKRF